MHMDTVAKIDLFIVSPDPYHREQLSRAATSEVSEGNGVRFMSAEDIILTKLRWYELGRGISDRQWNDLVLVIETQGDNLD